MINREIVYERNLTGSFMKIAAGIHAGLDEKLMLRRKLPGLLAVEKAYMDGEGHKNRKSEFPFVPFLLGAHLVMWGLQG